jgi:hypothetical protein
MLQQYAAAAARGRGRARAPVERVYGLAVS